MSSIVLPSPENIRLIISDLDGTLLNSEHDVSEKTLKTISSIIDNYNVNFVIATGKTRTSALPIRQKLNIMDKPNCPAIHNNGCLIYDYKNQVLKEYRLSSEAVLEILQKYKEVSGGQGSGCSYSLYSGDVSYSPWKDQWSQFLIDYKENVDFMTEEAMIQGLKTDTFKVNKICIFAKPEVIKEMKPILIQLQNKFPEIGLISSNVEESMEIVPANGNKGNALSQIMAKLQIKPDQVIAFGDGANDISMFDVAGFKYAMGNCDQELKSHATGVTKTNDEDGLAYILEKIFFSNLKN